MKEYPIPFRAEMVKAILNGTKTQTRRTIRPGLKHPGWTGFTYFPASAIAIECGPDYPDNNEDERRCPYGKPGDRLWVREACQFREEFNKLTPAEIGTRVGYCDIRFLADGATQTLSGSRTAFFPGRYRHARFMPRWASRITLEVTGVRVQRVKEISQEDALAEGFGVAFGPGRCRAFDSYWDDINGAGSWDSNPWVWVIEFKRVSA